MAIFVRKFCTECTLVQIKHWKKKQLYGMWRTCWVLHMNKEVVDIEFLSPLLKDGMKKKLKKVAMDNKPWERRPICHTSHRIKEGIYCYWVIFYFYFAGKRRGKECCHGYCHRLSSLFSFSILPSSLRLDFPPRSEQTIAVISTHAVWQVGLFKMTRWAEVIVLMWCSRGAVRSLNAVGAVQPLCVCWAAAV